MGTLYIIWQGLERLGDKSKVSLEYILTGISESPVDEGTAEYNKISKEVFNFLNGLIVSRGGKAVPQPNLTSSSQRNDDSAGVSFLLSSNKFFTGNGGVQKLSELRFDVTCKYKRSKSIYPQEQNIANAEIKNAIYYTEESSDNVYAVIKGNIYLRNKDTHEISMYSEKDISVYDFINDSRRIIPHSGEVVKTPTPVGILKKEYNKQRRFMGAINILTANEFVWLCYMLGFLNKLSK